MSKLLKNYAVGDTINGLKVVSNTWDSTSLTATLTLEGSLETIATDSIEDEEVKSLTLPDSVAQIKTGAFLDCTNLDTVDLGTTREDIPIIENNIAPNTITILIPDVIPTSAVLALGVVPTQHDKFYTYYTGLSLTQDGNVITLAYTTHTGHVSGTINWPGGNSSMYRLTQSTAITVEYTSDAAGTTSTYTSLIFTYTAPSSSTNTNVDLGLPSGNLWATCNVGASSPEAVGTKVSYGKTTTTTSSSSTTLISGTSEDIAYTTISTGCHIPTVAEWEELFLNTIHTVSTINGVSGYMFTSVTNSDNYIFIPYTNNNKYWTGELDPWENSGKPAYIIINNDTYGQGYTDGTNGFAVRPVYGTNISRSNPYGSTGSINSTIGVKLNSADIVWAITNVGATKTSDYGNYYAWGELNTKDSYTESTYSGYDATYDNGTDEYVSGNYRHYKHFANDISGNSTYDVARNVLGGLWRIPTDNELYFLRTYCNWLWITFNGIYGCRVYGVHDYKKNSVFFPAAGYKNGTTVIGEDEEGEYWDSQEYTLTEHWLNTSHAYCIEFSSNNVTDQSSDLLKYIEVNNNSALSLPIAKHSFTTREERCLGLPIRAVCSI